MKPIILTILLSVSSGVAQAQGFLCRGVQDRNLILSISPASYQASPPRYVLEVWKARENQLAVRMFGWVVPNHVGLKEFKAYEYTLSPSNPVRNNVPNIYWLKPHRGTSPPVDFQCYGHLGS